MSKRRFLVKLKDAHARTGLTPYAVAKELGLTHNTVRKFVTEDVMVDMLYGHVIELVEYYGLDWRDPDVIEIVEDDGLDLAAG